MRNRTIKQAKALVMLMSLLLLVVCVAACGEKEDEKSKRGDQTEEVIKWYKVKSEIFYNEDETEYNRREYSFDTDGRPIGGKYYHKQMLIGKDYNYQNNGLETVYETDTYNLTGTIIHHSKTKKVYWDRNYIKTKECIIYNEDGTENFRADYSFDKEGRPIGSKSYNKQGNIDSKSYNFQYNGLEVVYERESYDINGKITYFSKGKTVYLDKSYIKIRNNITYNKDGAEEYRTDNSFDQEGRPIGTISYNAQGKITSKTYNVQYNGLEATYEIESYSANGEVTSHTKGKTIYYQ